MFFTDFRFFFVFSVIFICYWIIPNKLVWAKKLFLLVVSYLLYMNFNPVYALLLLVVSLITFFGAELIDNGVNLAGAKPSLLLRYYPFCCSSTIIL